MFGAAVRFSLGGSSPQGQKPLFGKAEPPSKPIPPMAEMGSDDLDADELDAEEMDAEEMEFADDCVQRLRPHGRLDGQGRYAVPAAKDGSRACMQRTGSRARSPRSRSRR